LTTAYQRLGTLNVWSEDVGADDELDLEFAQLAGLSESFPTLSVEMTRAFNEDAIRVSKGGTSENTTLTRFEDFAVELASAYEAM
jgi:hypothetical protein